MKKQLLFLLFSIVQACCVAQEYDAVKQVKRLFNPDKDNKIYKRDRQFQFDYHYTKNDTSYLFAFGLNDTFDLTTDTAVKKSAFLVKQLSVKVIKPKLFARTNRFESEMLIGLDPVPRANEWTGLIENRHNVWLHPPRSYLFRILELNPYPYVKYPLVVGKQWQDSMRIGDHWADSRWKVWTGRILNTYHYEVKGKSVIEIDNQQIPCWIIQSSAKSRIGDTQLVSYFNEEYGFVKLDYINIDGSTMVIKLSKLPS